MSAKSLFCLPERVLARYYQVVFQTNQEDVDLYSTFFTVQVTSYPFPESVNKTKKGDDIVSKVTAAVTAFMGPGTLLDHFKIIPPNTSSVVQEYVILTFLTIAKRFEIFKYHQKVRTSNFHILLWYIDFNHNWVARFLIIYFIHKKF